MKIAYFKPDEGGCTYYRTILPLSTLMDKRADVECKGLEKDMKADELANNMGVADVMVFQRVFAPDMMTALKKAFPNKPMVIDYDDDYFKISPFSQHYDMWGTKEFTVMLDGKKLGVWEDGKNIDIKANKERIISMQKCMDMADMVTVTTQKLKNSYRGFSDNIQILPNCLDMDLWKKLPLIEDEKIRLFWAGGGSHYEDMYSLLMCFHILWISINT